MKYIDQKELRLAVHQLHEQAEKTNIAQAMINGTLAPIKYKRLCYQLYLICDFIEQHVDLPSHLQRRKQFVLDVAHCQEGSVEACFATTNYLNYLCGVTDALKGHIYAHYLGWLYGGQMIAKKLELPKNHLQFPDVKMAVDHVRNKILVDLTDDDAEEAKKAFEAIIAIYKEIDELH